MKLIVTGALQATAEELNTLASLGFEVTLHPDERQKVADPAQYDAAVCNGLFLHNDIADFSNLKLIQLTSAGMDRAPVAYAHSHGIKLFNAAGVYSVPMAEWTVMRLLELYKNAAAGYENQKNKLWSKDRGWKELSGSTACIVGFGAYGQETAKRLHAFGVNVTVVNRSGKESPFVNRFYPLEQLDEALADADIVILAIALTEQTRHLFDRARLAAMKPGALFLNAARGALVDENALVDALKTGYLAGAALDVFETEPLPEASLLWDCPNTLLSPHNSFVSPQNHHRLMDVVRKNLKNMER